MERKRARHYIKSLDEATRTVTGIFAVHGNIDDGGDMSVPGSFSKRLAGARVRFLWNHDSWQPPIASILSIREVGREELPPKVLEKAPEATGGVEVTRRYYEDVPLADWVWKAILAGDVTEMSYAYEVHGYEIREVGERKVRVLTDVELFDVSDVNWGMNPATAGVKGVIPGAGLTFSEHSEAVVSAVEEFLVRVKDRKAFREQEGRTLSEPVWARLRKLQEDLAAILQEAEPPADPQEALAEFVRFQQTLALLNGG